MPIEWSSPSIILNTRLYGETDGIATVLSLEQGLFRGLVKGMISRKQSPIWQIGNFISADWSARLSDQLGYFKGELVRANFAALISFPFAFSIMSSLCAVAEGSLLEKQPVPEVTRGLFKLLTFLSVDPQEAEKSAIAEMLRWEVSLLSALGYGLDFSICKHLGKEQSYWVSPKTGTAVTEQMAGEWKPRLFRLPSLFIDSNDRGDIADWCDGLNMTAYFLDKSVFSLLNKPFPNARIALQERVQAKLV